MSAYDILKTFNDRALSLIQSRFMMTMLATKTGVDVLCKGTEQPWWRLNVPDEEQAKAFILDYRLFVQDNDSISVRNMYMLFHSESSLSPFSREYDSLRDGINGYLDQEAFNDPRVTNRELQDVFLYGWYAHGNARQQEILSTWRGTEPRFAFMHHRFYCVATEVTLMIQRMRMLNSRALTTLGIPAKASKVTEELVLKTFE